MTSARWDRYLRYLVLWALDHADGLFEGMSPVCYEEFCDNEDELNETDEQE